MGKLSGQLKKYKIGLVLSGGGARGFAHLGVLKALEEKNMKPEIISGVSAGAIVGAFYGDGYSENGSQSNSLNLNLPVIPIFFLKIKIAAKINFFSFISANTDSMSDSLRILLQKMVA